MILFHKGGAVLWLALVSLVRHSQQLPLSSGGVGGDGIASFQHQQVKLHVISSSSGNDNTTSFRAMASATNETISNSERKKKKKKKKPKKYVKKESAMSEKMLGSQEAACLRRLRREWKDAVDLGVAYNWMQRRTISKSKMEKSTHVRIGPYGRSLLQWHFSIQGTPRSEFHNGVYHGRVLLPRDYPGSPPRIQLLTPSGRFVTGADICLSASAFHPETWTPRWTVLSLVEALRLHMVTPANEVGGVAASRARRRQLAAASREWATTRVSHAIMIRNGLFPPDENKYDEEEAEKSLSTSNGEKKKKKKTPQTDLASGYKVTSLAKILERVLGGLSRIIAFLFLELFSLLGVI